MNVIFHEDFYQTYTSDPAAEPGRLESIVSVLDGRVDFLRAEPAAETDIAAVHTDTHIHHVRAYGLYDLAALAAGATIQAAMIGMEEPAFALVRPPGHHASAARSWGFCYFNNMTVAVAKLKREERIERAFILDIDLHFGDGTVNILGSSGYTTIVNPSASRASDYLRQVEEALPSEGVDLIAVSAGFDYGKGDWGGVLAPEDYREIGRMVQEAAIDCGAGCFAVLEGGYNHRVLGINCRAFLEGLGDLPW
jgi:acetoin utilization deacetylase AcuC-like enzyme